MTSIRAVVADDDPAVREHLATLLHRIPGLELVGLAADGAEAVSLVRGLTPALLLLDVQMPGLDGFGVLDLVATGPAPPATIVITGDDRYAVRAFEARAIDFMIKPCRDDRVESAVHRACALLRAGGPPAAPRRVSFDRLAVRHDGRVLLIDVAEVDWVEACGVYVVVHVGPHGYEYRASLAQLAACLPSRFVRIHRSAIVNGFKIRELRGRGHGDYEVLLKNGTELVLSRHYRADVERWLRQPF